MPVVVVVGAQWGDEGKGKVVDLFTERASVVARWGGGANAGHTIVVDGKKYVTRLMPSGVLRKGVTCVLGEGMVIDPGTLLEEIRTFRGQGLLASDDDLVVACRAHLTFPYHREIDRLREERPGAIGTTKRGIGPTYESKASRSGVRVEDLLRPERLRAAVTRNVHSVSATLAELGAARPDVEAIVRDYAAMGDELRPFIRDASRFVHEQIQKNRNVLLEGAQGVLLDLDHGTYPFVSSSSTTAGGACAGLGIAPRHIGTVIGITKAYATRVGNGPFPTEQDNDIGARLREVGGEFGAVTGRPRRCGWLDIPALRLSSRISGIDSLALTKLDVLDGLEAVKVCVGYKLGVRTLDEMPLDLDDLAAAEPVYETFPGWPTRPAGGPPLTSEKQLPEAARRYVERLSELAGLPIALLSYGPGRGETLVKLEPFAPPHGR
jgi:adenylosuccinate synthase